MTVRRGFSVTELMMCVATCALLGCVLIVGGARPRGLASQSQSLDNLRQIGSVTRSYGADHADRMWGFTWRPDVPVQSEWPDIRAHAGIDAFTAAGAQAIDLLRRRTNTPNFPIPFSWVPHILYSHLVLADYMNAPMPMSVFVAPGDRNRRRWSENITAFRNGQLQPQPEPNPDNWRWSYSSSYELPVAWFAPDAVTSTTGGVVQGGAQNQYQLVAPTGGGLAQLGGRLLTDVRHPANKVLMYEQSQWQGARRDVYFMADHARVGVVMADGSTAVRPTVQANRGFQPAAPTNASPTFVTYSPAPWEPTVPTSGTGVPAYYRFTRSGLRGRDFDGQEVPWQP